MEGTLRKHKGRENVRQRAGPTVKRRSEVYKPSKRNMITNTIFSDFTYGLK